MSSFLGGITQAGRIILALIGIRAPRSPYKKGNYFQTFLGYPSIDLFKVAAYTLLSLPVGFQFMLILFQVIQSTSPVPNRYLRSYPVSSLGIPAILEVMIGSGNCIYSHLSG
jgi:hypothetical protein